MNFRRYVEETLKIEFPVWMSMSATERKAAMDNYRKFSERVRNEARGPLNEDMIPPSEHQIQEDTYFDRAPPPLFKGTSMKEEDFKAGEHYLKPSEDLLSYNDIPKLSDEDFHLGMARLQSDIEHARQDFFGAAYAEHYDPFRMGISDLPQKTAEGFIGRYDELTGARAFWEKGDGPKMFRDYYEDGKQTRSPAGRMEMTTEEIRNNPRAIALAQDTIRYDSTLEQSVGPNLAGERYFSAGNKYRPHVMKHFQELLKNDLDTPGRIAIFDVESSSLDPKNGIWQVSVRLMKDGVKIGEETSQVPNPRMKWGGVMGADALPLEDFLKRGSPPLDDYAVGMKRVLDVVNQADWVGGHNIFFDYGMMSRGLKENKSYSEDSDMGRAYRAAVDLFHEKFLSPKTGEIGKVLDTSILARLVLPDIELDEKLKGGFTPYQFSLQNLLLQTNLLQKVKEKEGEEQVKAWLAKGLHYADTDVPIESYLYTALQKHQRYLRGLSGGEELKMGKQYLSAEERKIILHSRAVGPTIAMSDISHLHPSLWDRARDAGLITKTGALDDYSEVTDIKVSPMEQMIALQRDMTMGADLKLGGLYPESQTLSEIMKTKGIWQGLKSKFWDVSSAGDSDFDIADKAGTWARMSRFHPGSDGWIRKDGQIATTGHPDALAWKMMQKDLQDKGIPLPGMSWIERLVSAELGQASPAGSNMDKRERDIRSIFGADVAPIGRFYAPKAVGVVGEKSQIITLPLQYLEEWEKERLAKGEEVSTAFSRPLEKSHFLYLSPFRHQDKKKDEIGLFYQIEHENDRQSLLNFLREHAGLKTDHPDRKEYDALMGRLEAAFRNNSGKYGIQVGTLGGLKGEKSTSRVAQVLRSIMGQGADTSDQTPAFWVNLLGRDILGGQGGETGAVYVAGGFMQPGLLSKEEREALPGQMSGLVTQYQRLHSSFKNNRRANYLRTRALKGAEDLEGGGGLYRFGEKALTRAPVFAAGAAIVAGGYYLHKKHQRDVKYDETMAYQPEETNGWYDRNQAQDIPDNPRRSPDYLNTASVVRNSDRRKINHTQMGSNKYSYLYKV